MALNPRGTFSQDLSLFGSRVTDILATDVPAGISPDNENCWYQPGMVATRPAYSKMLSSPIADNPNILNVEEFASPSGDLLSAFVDSTGAIWLNDPENVTSTIMIGQVAAGLMPKFENAFNKLWMAFYHPAVSSAFASSPFVGAGVPIYYNGTQINRVTSDAPGMTPTFSNIPQIAQSIPAITAGASFTVTAVESAGLETGSVYVQGFGWFSFSYYTQMVYTVTTTPAASLVNTLITVTGLTGTNASVANTTSTVLSVTSTTITTSIPSSLFVNLTGQSGTAAQSSTIYLTRAGNIVTVYLGGTSLPQNFKPGFWLSVLNSNGTTIQGPNWTITSQSRDTTGLVTVTVSSQLTNLPVGAILYLNPNPASFSGTVSVTNGSPTVAWVSGSLFNADMEGNAITIDSLTYTVLAVSTNGQSLSLTSNVTSTTGSYSYSASIQSFPAGYQTVYQVISVTPTATTFTYESLDTAALSSTSGGSVYQLWSPQLGTGGNAAQITAVGIDPNNGAYFQFFQLGPDTSIASGQGNISSPQAQIQGQIPPGLRNAVMMFLSEDGAITAPSQIVQITIIGGPNLLQVQGALVGPSGTQARILAFTPYNGSSWYYIAPAVLPAIGNSGLNTVLGTFINDNSSISAIIDFSDTQLTAATQIDTTGNNLFDQFVLPPALGVCEYSSRLFWWGLINNTRNLLNMGFDGGYLPPNGAVTVTNGSPNVTWSSGSTFMTGPTWNTSAIILAGVEYNVLSVTSSTALVLATNYTGTSGTVPFSVQNATGTAPPGWTVSTPGGAILVQAPETGNGFSCQISPLQYILQPAYQDEFGAPIVFPNTLYGFRCLASAPSATTFFVQLRSPSTGFTAQATVSVSSTKQTWCYAVMNEPLGSVIQPDLEFQIIGNNTVTITIDEAELIDAQEPVENTVVHASYVGNPFGYDAVTGIIGIDASESMTALFKQRGILYINTDESLFRSQDNGQTEPDGWDVKQYVEACGCSGPNAVDANEDIALWSGRYGGRIFNGNPSAKKITQEVASDWENHNWNYQTLDWVTNDPVQRVVYFGFCQTGQTSPSAILPMNYRLTDDAYNVPDPVHVSTYSGKMIATDLGRKWSLWTLGMNGAAMCTRPNANGLSRQIVFAGNNTGNLYTQDMVNFPGIRDTDDDYGAIGSYYTTYFFPDHMAEQQPIVSSYRKFFGYQALHLTGKGQAVLTPFVDSLSTPWSGINFNLTGPEPGFDYQVPFNVRGDRMAVKVGTTSLSGGPGGCFVLTHMIFSCQKDMVFPVRAALQ